jgi:hypothetical protein
LRNGKERNDFGDPKSTALFVEHDRLEERAYAASWHDEVRGQGRALDHEDHEDSEDDDEGHLEGDPKGDDEGDPKAQHDASNHLELAQARYDGDQHAEIWRCYDGSPSYTPPLVHAAEGRQGRRAHRARRDCRGRRAGRATTVFAPAQAHRRRHRPKLRQPDL